MLSLMNGVSMSWAGLNLARQLTKVSCQRADDVALCAVVHRLAVSRCRDEPCVPQDREVRGGISGHCSGRLRDAGGVHAVPGPGYRFKDITSGRLRQGTEDRVELHLFHSSTIGDTAITDKII